MAVRVALHTTFKAGSELRNDFREGIMYFKHWGSPGLTLTFKAKFILIRSVKLYAVKVYLHNLNGRCLHFPLTRTAAE